MSNAISLENLQSAFAQNKAYTDAKYDGHLDKIDDMKNIVDDLNLRSMIGEKLDHIHVVLSNDQVMVNNEIVKFDKVVDSNNMSLDTSNYTIRLKKGKTYDISMNMYTHVKNDFNQVLLFDITNNKSLVLISSISSTNTAVNTPSPFGMTTYTPITDCDIQAKIVQTNGSTINHTFGAFLNVKEIGRTYIIDPMDVKNEHTVEYGSFKTVLDSNMGLNVGTIIPFTEINSTGITGNLNGVLTLKAGKTYKTEAWINMNTSGAIRFSLVNYHTGESIGTGLASSAVSSNYSSPRSDNPYSGIVTIDNENVDVCFKVASKEGSPTFVSFFATVQEIAQPVVTEYNHYSEISNPLTTSDISDETPVGSILSYLGEKVPKHYLKMDGAIYNISDYPHLSKHILNEFGLYNYYGGDGITTFAVPNELLKEENIFENVTPKMKSNTSPSPYVVTASGVYNTTYDAFKAFDGIDSTLWETPNGVIQGWIQLDFNKQICVNRLSILGSTTDGNLKYCLKSFELFGSNDEVEYTKIFEIDKEPAWFVNETRAYEFVNGKEFRYYKLNILDNQGGTIGTILHELNFYKTKKFSCIKYEPTYYAVNQYGGFESNILWEGSTISDTANTLTNNILDYDYLEIQWGCKLKNGSYRLGRPYILNTRDIKYKKTLDSSANVIAGDCFYNVAETIYQEKTLIAGMSVQFAFLDNNRFFMSGDGRVSVWDTKPTITKIVGIKGQLPTLLQGGLA